jgi:hypothetical protein
MMNTAIKDIRQRTSIRKSRLNGSGKPTVKNRNKKAGCFIETTGFYIQSN